MENIKKIYLDDKEISVGEAKEYIQDHMTLQGFLGGVKIITPDGILQIK